MLGTPGPPVTLRHRSHFRHPPPSPFAARRRPTSVLTHGESSLQPRQPSSSAHPPQSVTLHTSHGDLKIEVFCDAVPVAAENFLALAASKSYDGCKFHRSIRGFMVQTGNPSTKADDSAKPSTGGGGQSIWGKPFADEIRSTLKFNVRGVVAMANSGPDTNKSQFFITYSKQPHLDGKYTIFGKVIDGADSTLDEIERIPVNEKNRPKQDIILHNVTIHANPIADATLGK
ncbi:hypothetical protein M0805_009880 [Coniferiporia weirii]|nr:hypothetical protein M0805_009880 [Coniferiporia weirii]